MMNHEKTRQYYAHLTEADLCDCAYCRNYRKEIRGAYPELSGFLREIGVDIEKPLEVIPIAPDQETMYYGGVQYVVMGTAEDFRESSVGDVRVSVTDSHPMTDVKEDHFVIETSSLRMKWSGDER